MSHDRHYTGLGPQIVHEAARNHGISTLRVLHCGEVAVTVGPQDAPMPINSIRKSMISAPFGRLIDAGVISLDATLSDIGVDDSPSLTQLERSATIEHLLTSRSGVYLPLSFESSYDIFRNMPARWPDRGSDAPGTTFHYNNWDFNVPGEIYERAAEIPLFVAMDHLLAKPLGFRDWNPLDHARLYYVHDPVGATPRFPYYAMQLSARDLARFGQLYLNQGNWEAQQVVPASWIQQSTQSHVDTGLPSPFAHYGYLWWTIDDNDGSALPGGSYSAIGLGGQTLSVVPAHKMVIVAMRSYRDGANTSMALPDDIVNAVLGMKGACNGA